MFTSQPLRVDWDQDLPYYWNDSSPFKTHWLNALNINFPDGERFFIASLKAYQHVVTDPVQSADFNTFVKQENWHGHVHEQYTQWLERRGLPALDVKESMRKFWSNLRPHWGDRTCLTATVCIEHITAVNAEYMLRYRTIMRHMDPHFETIWRWHGVEEIEHKSVAMDVWQSVDGDVNHRRLVMLFVYVYYMYYMIKNTATFLRADQQLWKWRTFKDACTLLFDRQCGAFWTATCAVLEFMRPDWHPNRRDHSILLNYSKT
jgi:predicted metal-dependent hydrolase